MKSDNFYEFSAVDFARQIIDLHNENSHLRSELMHYKELAEMGKKSMQDTLSHNGNMVGMILNACLDPESNINRVMTKRENVEMPLSEQTE